MLDKMMKETGNEIKELDAKVEELKEHRQILTEHLSDLLNLRIKEIYMEEGE